MTNEAPTSSKRTISWVLLFGAVAIIAAMGGGTIALLNTPATAPAASEDAAPAVADLETALASARQYLNEQKPGAAETILRAAAARWPDDQDVCLLFGETLLQMGLTTNDPDESRELQEQALAQYDRAILLGPEHPEHHHAAGLIATRLGRFEDAAAHFAQAQQLDRSNPKYPLYLAQVQRTMGELDRAKQNLLLAGKLDPDLALAWAGYAAIALDENDLGIASTMIGKARELEPGRLEWRLIEARVLRRQGRATEALDILLATSEGARFASNEMLAEIALCYGMTQQPDAAVDMYAEAVERRPEDPVLHYEYALWLERTGDVAAATEAARRASRLGHEPASAWLDAKGD